MTVQQSNSEPTELDAGLTDEYYHWREQGKTYLAFLLERQNKIELPTSAFYHILVEMAQRPTWFKMNSCDPTPQHIYMCLTQKIANIM